MRALQDEDFSAVFARRKSRIGFHPVRSVRDRISRIIEPYFRLVKLVAALLAWPHKAVDLLLGAFSFHYKGPGTIRPPRRVRNARWQEK